MTELHIHIYRGDATAPRSRQLEVPRQWNHMLEGNLPVDGVPRVVGVLVVVKGQRVGPPGTVLTLPARRLHDDGPVQHGGLWEHGEDKGTLLEELSVLLFLWLMVFF